MTTDQPDLLPDLPADYQWRHNPDERRWEIVSKFPGYPPRAWVTDEALADTMPAALQASLQRVVMNLA